MIDSCALNVLANPYFQRFRYNTAYLYRTLLKSVTIKHSHIRLGRAHIRELMISHDQIRVVKVAMDAIRANKLRSILTMLGIVIGVGAVITMVALGEGAQRAVQEQIT